MIVVTLDKNTFDYLKFVLESHCENGLPTGELQIAANAWACIQDAKEVTKDGIRLALSGKEFTPLAPPEAEVQHIQGPLNVQVNGDMTLPISQADADEMKEQS